MSTPTVYAPSQIAQIASVAGFRGQGLYMSVAIAMAESGGNPTVWTAVGDVGLWQINIHEHPQYTLAWLQNPNNNAKAAYSISSGGQNWRAWCTAYSDGACGSKGGAYLASGSPYQKYLSNAQAITNVGAATGGAAAGPQQITLPKLDHQPWWTFPRIDNLGARDPMGNFPKPDSNIQIPDGYPIEALLPGTVSGINKGVSYGCVVTIRLDSALNRLATHTFYEHLRGDIRVNVGQHVSSGQLIAYNGGGQACGTEKVPLGFGLYPGDNYATDGGFAQMTVANLTGGGLLNPVNLLNQAKSGKLNLPTYSGVPSSGGTPAFVPQPTPTFIPLLSQVHETLINTPGFYGIALAIDEAEKFPGWLDLTTKQPDISILGVDTGVALPDIIGDVRSVGATIGDNALPALIRSGTSMIGVILLVSLLVKLVEKPVKEILPLAMEGAALL